MKFFFYYPTFNKPSGGNKQIRVLASLLLEAGHDVFLLRDSRFDDLIPAFDDNLFYDVDIPTASFRFEAAGSHLGASDILILPEVLLEQTLDVCAGWSCRIGLNNQNGFFGLRYAPTAKRKVARIEFAIANAPFVAGLCSDIMGIPSERVFLIPYWIVRPPFDFTGIDRTKTLAVCFMPRKLPTEVSLIRELVSKQEPFIPWVEIDGMPEAGVAEIYRNNAVFFAPQDLEGFGLPAVEAMTCGCLVAGFPGTGRFRPPYATSRNGFWAKDRDIQGAADAVLRAIRMARDSGVAYEERLQAGRQTADLYSKSAATAALGTLLVALETGRYSTRRRGDWHLSPSEKLFAYWMLYQYERLGPLGHAVSAISRWTKPLRH